MSKYYSHALFSIVMGSEKKRDSLIARLTAKKIPTVIYYRYPIHLMKGFKYLGYNKKDFSVSELLSKTIVSLPMHPYLADEELEKIKKCIIQK